MTKWNHANKKDNINITTNNGNNKKQFTRVIIHGVTRDLTESEIIQETGATEAKRLQQQKHNTLQPTNSVILKYNGEAPGEIYIGLVRFQAQIYVPSPMRCDNCQTFGHHKSTCKRTPICSHCSKNHTYIECTTKNQQPKCANCGKEHSAAYRGC
jgi:hypothetical protein